MTTASDTLTGLFTPTVEAMGYELVGVEYLSQGSAGSVLRVYIDRPEGITLDDCSRVSHQISGILDVEDPIAENYSLEVSSPGLDRPLFGAKDFERFAGSEAVVKLRVKVDGQRKFKGVLQSVEGRELLLAVDDKIVRLPLDQVDRARLVPEF
jgi:ribosome maturation factor RimP